MTYVSKRKKAISAEYDINHICLKDSFLNKKRYRLCISLYLF